MWDESSRESMRGTANHSGMAEASHNYLITKANFPGCIGIFGPAHATQLAMYSEWSRQAAVFAECACALCKSILSMVDKGPSGGRGPRAYALYNHRHLWAGPLL